MTLLHGDKYEFVFLLHIVLIDFGFKFPNFFHAVVVLMLSAFLIIPRLISFMPTLKCDPGHPCWLPDNCWDS